MTPPEKAGEVGGLARTIGVMDSIYRVSSVSGAVRNRITGFERSAMRTDARLLRSQLSPLAGVGSTLAFVNGIGKGVLGTAGLMNGVLGGLWGFSRGWPDLSMIDRSDRPAWASAQMDLLYRSTRSGPYGLAHSFVTASREAGLTLVRVLSRAGPAPPGFWRSAVGRAQRAAVLRWLSFGRTLPALALKYLRSACAGVISAFTSLWRKRALWAHLPHSSLAWLQRPHRKKAPSRLIRSNPDRAHAPPAGFRRGCSSDRERTSIAA